MTREEILLHVIKAIANPSELTMRVDAIYDAIPRNKNIDLDRLDKNSTIELRTIHKRVKDIIINIGVDVAKELYNDECDTNLITSGVKSFILPYEGTTYTIKLTAHWCDTHHFDIYITGDSITPYEELIASYF